MTKKRPKRDLSDAYGSWNLAIASMREICIRRRQILPRDDDPQEQRWALEGECPVAELETVRAS